MELLANAAASVGNALFRFVLGGVEASPSCEEKEEEAPLPPTDPLPDSGPGFQRKRPLRCDFEGLVTTVLEDRVLVNGHIVVDAKLLKDDVDCGTALKGVASRQTPLDNWSALEVEIVAASAGNEQEVWDDVVPERIQERLREKPAAAPGKRVAMVTGLARGRGVLNNNLEFCTGVCEPGFRALKGDWVLAQLESAADGEGPLQVTRVSVLRKAAFHGRVTGLTRDAGFINHQIWFQRRDCDSGFYPRVGDLVAGWCMESVQGRDCTFRALSIRRDAPDAEPNGQGDRPGDRPPPSLTIVLPPPNGSGSVLDFGLTKIGTVVKGEVKILNKGPVPLQINHVGFLNRGGQFRTDHTPWPKLVEPGRYCALVVRYTVRHLGVDQQQLTSEFAGGYRLVSVVRGTGFDPLAEKLTNGLGRGRGRGRGFVRQQQAAAPPANRFVMPGVRPTTSDRPLGRFSYRLKPFSVPKRLRDILALPSTAPHALMETKSLLEDMTPSLCQPLPTITTFVARWSILLYAEEVQEEEDLRQFDIPSTSMQRKGDFLALQIDGLKEGRPSVVTGDRVLCSRMGSASDVLEGFVHEVRREEVLLKFHYSVHQNFDPATIFRVEFTVNRVPFRRMHQALETAVTSLGETILFPTPPADLAPPLWRCPAGEFVRNARLNAEQRAAVVAILEGRGRPRPYIIFGPPGTGKTTTLVEAALQLHLRLPASRLLLTAPSNSAADLLCELLLRTEAIGPGEMVRLLAASRDVSAAPEAIRAICSSRDDVGVAAMHRIVVATCVSSGVLFSLGLPAGHFTHVLVDEAGQATEPECLIPMGVNAQSDGVSVLAGDPFQLGPVLSSRWALRYGLQRSYLERLLSSSSYSRDESGFNPHLVTKLVRNYRAHPAILEPYSQLFYESELQPHACSELTDRLLTWPGFPNPDFPVVFMGIRGSELRDPNSPSFFNPAEVVEVVRVAGRLLAFGLASCDLGIITPYRKQVEKIRELLASTSGADLIKVGSVEEFQGQERPAIVVSTVRSDEGANMLRLDQALGFLTNPKRFNVTISRAQAALVVVGNPFVLCNDPQWLHFLRYVIANGAYNGCDLDAISHILKVENGDED